MAARTTPSKVIKLTPAKAKKLSKNLEQASVQLKELKTITGTDLKSIQSAVDDFKNNLDSMSEMGEMESLRLQMAMDRMSKMMTTLSNLLKKISDTQESIVGNLK